MIKSKYEVSLPGFLLVGDGKLSQMRGEIIITPWAVDDLTVHLKASHPDVVFDTLEEKEKEEKQRSLS